MGTFILAEKPSVARDIAKAIGAERKGVFFHGDGVVVGYARGHLYEIAEANAPKEWTLEGLPVLPERFLYEPRPGTKELLEAIRKELRGAKEVVIATDPGREGELIARLILLELGWRAWDRTYRLWTAEALTPEVVRKALRALRPASEFDSLYHAARARAEGDWIVGINLTRLVTLQVPGHGVWSVGRVQTPTLKLLVDREWEIRAFVPKPYGVVRVQFQAQGGAYAATWVPPRELPSPEAARRVAEAVRQAGEGRVLEVRREEKREPPPLLHNLASLQRAANARLGFGAQKTLDLAQALYEKWKCVSYPRTESRHLPESARGLVERVLSDLGREDLLQGAEKAGKRVFDDAKLTDHHAIIPLAAPPAGLSKDERALFDLIARRFFAAFSGDFRYVATTALTESAGERFRSRTREILEGGWTREEGRPRAEKEEEEPEEASFPAQEGEKVRVLEAQAQERETKPPARYTEGSLVRAMENLGLGTPATRAAVLETLKERGYAEVRGKALVPTPKGEALVDYLGESPVVSPEMTAEWERSLESIWREQKGEEGYQEFMTRIRAFTREAVEALKQKEMDHALKRKATRKMLDYARSLARSLGWKLTEDGFEEVKAFIERARSAQEEVLGLCACGAPVRAQGQRWACENGHAVWQSFLGSRLSKEEALALLQGKEVVKRGLKSKAGKPFAARLVFDPEEGRVKIAGFIPSGGSAKGRAARS